MKKKMLLVEVLKLKSDVEKSIEGVYNDIFKYNESETKIDLLLERLDKLEVQLLIFKEVIQEVNKGKIKGVTNNYNIYYLSSLVARYEFYRKLQKTLRRSKTPELAQINLEVVTSRKKQIEIDILSYREKLSEFNNKKKVTVVIDESLGLM
jgi:hypothetical protein